jgi:DNA-binding transcriptional LysR family regulator
MLDPRRLLTFREVARRGSFSRAAVELALTQPAVSQQIRALETQLGERLIERRRGVFALTPAGDLLLAHADAVSDRLRLAETQLDETIAEGRRRLRVGAFPSVLVTLIPRAIAALQASVDDLEVSIVQGSTDDLVPAVRDGRLHVALCFQDAAESRREHAETRRRDLLDEPMLATIGPDHRLAGRARLRLAQLGDDTWTAATPDGLIHRACVAAGFEPRIAYLTADPLAIRALVAAGLAVTMTPQLLAGELEGVVTPSLIGEPARRTIYAVTPSTGTHPLVAPFLDALGSGIARARDRGFPRFGDDAPLT